MSCIEKANSLGKAAVTELIAKAGIYEYGTVSENFADKMAAVKSAYVAEAEPMLVAAGLSNNDFSHMLLKILKETPEKVLDGLRIIADLMDAQKTFLYLPENETDLAASLKEKADAAGIEICEGIVNTRMLRDGLICHLETAAAVADAVEGSYQANTLISAVRYVTSESFETAAEPSWVSFGTKVAELGLDLTDAKAVQIGQKLYDPAEAAEVVIAPEFSLGDGVIRIYGNGCCMVDMAEKKLMESRKNSCGKCTFCREGLNQLYIRTHETAVGKGSSEGLEVMEEIGEAMSFSCNCTIGNFGSAFTLETMARFDNEYQSHMKRKCPAGTCLAFVNVYIDPKKCTGCGKCLPVCPADCMEGVPGYIHMIEDLDCTKCGKCMEACPEDAVVRTTERVPMLPDRLTRVGRFKRY